MDDELQLLDDSVDDPVETPEPAPDDDLRAQIDAEQAANRDLLERLRLALLASDPAIDPDLVRGGTAEEVEASFAAAQRTVATIRDTVRREQAASIPAGAPGRVTAGPSSAYDKIRAGLSRLSAL